MAEENSTLTVLTGSTAQNAATPTTPILDGSMRAVLATIVVAIVGGACKVLDLSTSDTASVLAAVPVVLIFLLGLFDKFIAVRL